MDDKTEKSAQISTEVRPLRESAEVEPWLDFVASCFAFKGTPREHFSSHFYLDPWKNHASVFVAEEKLGEDEKDEKDKQIYVDGHAKKCTGIGEVCTREDRRRMGLSNIVLSHATDSMHKQGYDLASLHSSQMAVVYQKAGFQTVPLTFTCHTFTARPSASTDGCRTIQPADMKDKTLIGKLMVLHASFNARYDGPIVRDHEEYWSGYMHSNMQDSGYVLTRQGEKKKYEDGVLAFASLKANKSKPGSFLLADFFCHQQEIEQDGGLQALQLLVGAALEGRGVEEAAVQLPLAVAKKMDFFTKGHRVEVGGQKRKEDESSLQGYEGDKDEEESKDREDEEGKDDSEQGKEACRGREERVVDMGFMYKRLAPEGEEAYPEPDQHVFWPVDAY